MYDEKLSGARGWLAVLSPRESRTHSDYWVLLWSGIGSTGSLDPTIAQAVWFKVTGYPGQFPYINKWLIFVQNLHALLKVFTLKNYLVRVCKTIPCCFSTFSDLFTGCVDSVFSLPSSASMLILSLPAFSRTALLLWPHTQLDHLTPLHPPISPVPFISSFCRLVLSVSSTNSFPVAIKTPPDEVGSPSSPAYLPLSPLASHLRVHHTWDSRQTPVSFLSLLEASLSNMKGNGVGSDLYNWKTQNPPFLSSPKS